MRCFLAGGPDLLASPSKNFIGGWARATFGLWRDVVITSLVDRLERMISLLRPVAAGEGSPGIESRTTFLIPEFPGGKAARCAGVPEVRYAAPLPPS